MSILAGCLKIIYINERYINNYKKTISYLYRN